MKTLKRAATNPSQASYWKLIELYSLKNGVTFKIQHYRADHNHKQPEKQPNAWTFQRQLECSPLTSDCSPGPVVLFPSTCPSCLQLFTDFRQEQFWFPAFTALFRVVTEHMINNNGHINLQYLNNIMKPDFNQFLINYCVCNCLSYKNALKHSWSCLQSSNLPTLT